MLTQKEEQGFRLRKIIDTLGVKQAEFSRQVGVTQGYLSRVLNGHKSISWKMTIGIAKAFPEVNQNWITSGTGEMFLPRSEKKYEEEPVSDQRVSEAIAEYVAADPLGSVRLLLEEYERRLGVLEAEVARLKEGNKTDGI